jgi:multisubunit Na+/H+ antiporter MnhG subunit
MTSSETTRIPVTLLVLDVLGAILAGIGLADGFAQTNLVPEGLRFPHYPWVLIVCGALLMAPMGAHMVRRARRAQQAAGRRGQA